MSAENYSRTGEGGSWSDASFSQITGAVLYRDLARWERVWNWLMPITRWQRSGIVWAGSFPIPALEYDHISLRMWSDGTLHAEGR